jgi:hypothetical protein
VQGVHSARKECIGQVEIDSEDLGRDNVNLQLKCKECTISHRRVEFREDPCKECISQHLDEVLKKSQRG